MVDDRARGELFSGVVPFVTTAEELSFRGAAARLGVSAAAVSKAIAKLEQDLGVRLLNRTSRHVSLTREGELYRDKCREAVAALHEARERVARAQQQPHGELRVTAPIVLGRLVVPALATLRARHAALTLRISITDRMVRLADEDVDVAVRIGELENSSLGARLLRQTRWVTLASPAYLARRGTPRRPADLATHECVEFLSPRGAARAWPYRGPRGSVEQVAARGTCLVDHGDALLDAALADAGIVQVFDFMVEEHLRAGRLVEVLADHAIAGPPIHALWLHARKPSPKVRACVDALVAALGAKVRRP